MFWVKFHVVLHFSKLRTALMFLLSFFRVLLPRSPCPPVGACFPLLLFPLLELICGDFWYYIKWHDQHFNSLFSPLPPRKDIQFKEHLIWNKQHQQKNLCSWNRGSINDEKSFGNISVAAFWSSAKSVVVVISNSCSSVCSHNLESSFTFSVISGNTCLCFTDTFPLEMY